MCLFSGTWRNEENSDTNKDGNVRAKEGMSQSQKDVDCATTDSAGGTQLLQQGSRLLVDVIPLCVAGVRVAGVVIPCCLSLHSYHVLVTVPVLQQGVCERQLPAVSHGATSPWVRQSVQLYAQRPAVAAADHSAFHRQSRLGQRPDHCSYTYFICYMCTICT